MGISLLCSPHKNIYREKFADFGLEKKEKDNFLMVNNGKIKINTCVADFCSYCFNINFILTWQHIPVCCLCFVLQQRAPLSTEFPFFSQIL